MMTPRLLERLPVRADGHRGHGCLCLMLMIALVVGGCKPASNSSGQGSSGSGLGTSTGDSGPAPTFSLAWSEYPSWSVFGVADELGLIDGAAGRLGEIENRLGVDIELREAGYDSCLNMYASGDCDAVCITNMDAYIVSPSRSGVAVLPTSTSQGADACLVTEKVADIEALKGVEVYGLEGTVSQYCFARCLELSNFDEADFKFTNQDPAIAAQNMQNKAGSHQAIMVWNPFVLQTLRTRPDVRVLFDSSMIPGEIVDMVVVGSDVIAKPKSDAFIKAVIETFYAVNKALEDPEKGDEVLVALGDKFSDLNLAEMKQVVQQTVFYKNPQDAISLLEGDAFKERMKLVTDFCQSHGLLTEASSVAYGSGEDTAKLRFDASYLK